MTSTPLSFWLFKVCILKRSKIQNFKFCIIFFILALTLPLSLASYIELVKGRKPDDLGADEDKTMCYILKDSLIIMGSTELPWALTSIMFRFIMVKYADRGLVSGGTVSILFDILYACFGAFLTLFCYALTVASNLREGEEKFISICLKHDSLNNVNTLKSLIIKYALTILGLIVFCIMLWSSIAYVKSRSRDGKTPPAIIGRYQRNIITFVETVIYHVVFTLILIIFPFVNISYNVIYGCILTICQPILFNTYLLIKSLRIPLASNSNSAVAPSNPIFYIREPVIQPRRDHFIPQIPNPVNIVNAPVQPVPIPANFIYVQPINDQN